MTDVQLRRTRTTASQAVATTVLQVFGDTNWTVATAQTPSRLIQLRNPPGGADLFIKKVVVAAGASLTGLVSSTDYHYVLRAGSDAQDYRLTPDESLVVVTTGSATIEAIEYTRLTEI